jgi:hypothetical protein
MSRARQSILPPVTEPWDRKLHRAHQPPRTAAKDGWRSYRPCLRWEFAFSCAFCLCHEADLATAGVEGWGLTAIEHFVPKSKSGELRNEVTNLFYVCGRCNRARGIAPNQDDAGGVLLSPCDAAWGEKFTASQGRLEARDAEDADSRYTRDVYRLNDRSKTKIRQIRQQIIASRKSFLERTREKKDELFDRAIASGEAAFIDMAYEIRELRHDAALDLLRYRAVPSDRDRPCGCDDDPSLPAFLEDQTFDLLELI